MAILNALATVLAMLTFFGIVWWAWSSGRKQANREAAMLPFALPDEGPDAASTQAGVPAGGNTAPGRAPSITGQHNGGSHE